MINDVVDRHWHRRVVTLNHHAKRIANEHEVCASRIDEHGKTSVIGGQAGNRLAFTLHLRERRDVDRRLCHAALFELCVHQKRPLVSRLGPVARMIT